MTSEPPHCYTCHEEIYFEKGSKVPLDPVTKQKHEHKKKEESNGKSEDKSYSLQAGNRNSSSRIQWFKFESAEQMELAYANFMDEIEAKGGFSQGCPTQIVPGIPTIYSMVIFYKIPKDATK